MTAPLAVFTGDIVASSRLAPAALDAAMAGLEAAAEAAAAWACGPGPGARFTRFRGDGWQCLAPGPGRALRAALFLRARLRAEGRDRDTRIGLGIGAGRVPRTGDLSAAEGAAFRRSGAALDAMGRAPRFALDDEGRGPALSATVLTLCDALSQRWTPAQARVFARLLPPEAPTQTETAEALEISQQTVAGHWRAGGGWALETALEAWEGLHPQP